MNQLRIIPSALLWYVINSVSPITNNSVILRSHDILMKDQPQFNPGKWREYNVTVGYSIPPHYSIVPKLMDEFNRFIISPKYDDLFKAVYSHIWFERIHPFADGNGRIGRAVLTVLSGLPVSKKIYEDRQTYYNLLGYGSWDEWKEWMLDIMEIKEK